MNADCYAIRQLSPYRGMLFVIEVEGALAYSSDGHIWQVHCKNPFSRYWPAGEWIEGEGGTLTHCQHQETILQALENHPPLPFAAHDQLDLWLLDKQHGLPLALLKTQRDHTEPATVGDPTWYPFALTDTAFTAACQAEADARRDPRAWPVPHRDVVSRLVNEAARPLPAAQWFRRGTHHSDIGLNAGLRLDPVWVGRQLSGADFPELLTQSGLRSSTRKRLEAAAAEHPERLLKIYRVLPAVADASHLNAMLVAARLTQTTPPI
ncbi:hypothetical protein [Sulfuriferula sp.]|uniref:hypothetical protein n=1 Tax=Sulfuriferula sp. TaxID=2025307 RepID=UPI0027301E77|nr:hypothetical protein [Sulfuriferula sp.]MDP2027701.1 hypothetical protein [Sulfuriferula sp.]